MKNKLLFLFLVILATGCKKTDPTVYLSEDIKTKFSFKPGSYWIYRDSISGRVDSCYLNEVKSFIPKKERSDPWTFEVLTINFIQKPIVNVKFEKIDWLMYFHNGTLEVQYKSNEAGSIRMLECGYPIPMSNSGLLIGSWEGSTRGLTNFALNGNTFDTVYEINTFDKSQNSYNFNNTCILNDSVGFIKMRLNYNDRGYTINEVWELQRWHIVK